MVLIHEKITALLEQRRLKKRDLARALSVSPQTATDICKGRSAITLPHLRNLISFFEVRADFWLDDEKLAPTEIDRPQRRAAADQLSETGLLQVEDPMHLMGCMRTFIQQQQDLFLASNPDVTASEKTLLGLAETTLGTARKVGEMGAEPTTIIPAVAPASGLAKPPGNAAGGAHEAEFGGQ